MRFDPERRWHDRIYRDGLIDVWLITWMPTQGTVLHDHGGSNGAFGVLSGELSEAIYLPRAATGEKLIDVARGAGERVGFGAGYVHDVRNLSDEPAVSIHAYSSPLTRMNYYDLNEDELVTIGSLDTEDPEAHFVAPAVAS
jgi:predicted metal-dependent enzyme (double-stranded beta helix superfamily)